MWKKFIESRLVKNINIGFDKFIQNAVVIILGILFASSGVILVILVSLGEFLQSETIMPNSILFILIAFSLVGVLVPSKKLIDLIRSKPSH